MSINISIFPPRAKPKRNHAKNLEFGFLFPLPSCSLMLLHHLSVTRDALSVQPMLVSSSLEPFRDEWKLKKGKKTSQSAVEHQH